ncbi:MAG: hypothetical protein AB1668_03785 [Nanoarchaeota archaeon]
MEKKQTRPSWLKENRKAQVLMESVFMLVAMIVFVGLFLWLGFVFVTYSNKATAVPAQLQAELVSLRFTNNPHCFAYVDENTGRVYSDIIDLKKFNEDNMNNCYKTGDLQGLYSFNFRLNLTASRKGVVSDKYRYHDDFSLLKEVLVKEEGKLKKDQMVIYVQKI